MSSFSGNCGGKRLKSSWHTAALVPDEDCLGRRRALDHSIGLIGRADGVFFSAAASDPVTVRIDLN
jgi:hypothetical protein